MYIANVGLYLVADDCPIEFVIIGPQKSSVDSVIVRSGKMRPELLGFAIGSRDSPDEEKYDFYESDFPSANILKLISGRPSNRINRVVSREMESSEPTSRGSSYTFAWVGGSTLESRKRVQRVFEERLLIIQQNIQFNEYAKLEWNLSPILFECTKANERYLGRVSFIRLYFLLVGFFGLLFAVIAIAILVTQTISKR